MSEQKSILAGDQKMCGSHYHDLCAQLRRKGLWHLCAQDNNMREQRAFDWLRGTTAKEEFDPMVVCMVEMQGKVRELAGGGIPLGCALCNAMKILDREDVPALWLDNVTDLMIVTARTNGLKVR